MALWSVYLSQHPPVFLFFYNETGWNGRGTAYDALGPRDTPHYDSDFRHVGLMHSDDEGKTWTFDRWVLTAEHVCFTEQYSPDAGLAQGQKTGIIGLGSGDFSLYVEPEGDYLYLFYDIIRLDITRGEWVSCDVHVARARKRTDGVMGDFVKYYNGSFGEAGNLGKESPISYNPLTGRVLGDLMEGVLTVRESQDLLHWSEPIRITKDGQPFGNHYMALVGNDNRSQPNVITGDFFSVLTNHNGTDVDHHRAQFVAR